MSFIIRVHIVCAVHFYRIWPFLVNRCAKRGGHKGGGAKSPLSLLPYFFWKHVPSCLWCQTFTTECSFRNWLLNKRGAVQVLKYPFSFNISELNSIWFSLNLTLYYKPNLVVACFLFLLIEFDPFRSIGVLRGGVIREGAVRGLSYRFSLNFFESRGRVMLWC